MRYSWGFSLFFIKQNFIIMSILYSERIKLVPLTLQQLQLWAEGWSLLEKSLGVKHLAPDIDPLYQVEIDDALENFWLPKVAENPDNYLWFTAWQIVHLDQNVIIGGVGVSYPDENGECMTGYHIDRRFQRQGFASEALKTLLTWAFQNPNLHSVIATVPLGNDSSHGVVLKNGFRELKRDSELVYWQLVR
jgi:[ribosomal protein S5]-alanine N-acetyltransferase